MEVILPLTSFFRSHMKYINLWMKVLKSTEYFSDISKAFDRVWHDGLLFKLQKNGISGKILLLLKDFLKSRKQQVV